MLVAEFSKEGKHYFFPNKVMAEIFVFCVYIVENETLCKEANSDHLKSFTK